MQEAQCNATLAQAPQVFTQQGILKGQTLRTRKGRDICAFKGVPYAKPPLGELRFKDPQEAPIWTGIRDATEEGARCIQTDFFTKECIGSEDCLYLNVYTPQTKRDGAGLSVMVWVHGGGFHSGSGSPELYGPEFLLDHDIILVTFNYRVGLFGFLSLDTPDAPGNYGLKDQVAVLRWVHKNISSFGGNPNNVTIFGESAGGASIHYLMLSPLTRGLFHRAIAQSGSAHNPWAFQINPSRNGFEAAGMLGYKQLDAKMVLAGLRSKNAQDITKLDYRMRVAKKALAIFSPVIEPPGTVGAFLSEDPRLMLARGDFHTNVPFMAGIMTHEGLMQLGDKKLAGVSFEDDFKNNFYQYIPKEFNFPEKSPECLAVWREIEQFYEKLAPSDLEERFALINSDVEFVVGVDELVRGVAALCREPVYYYEFSYNGGLGLIKKLSQIEHEGTCHADELGYLFSRTLIPGELEHASSADHVTIDRITKLWTEFAKTGTPTPSGALGVTWTPVEAPLHKPNLAITHYLDIGECLEMKNKNLKAHIVEFWQKLKQKYQSQNKKGKL